MKKQMEESTASRLQGAILEVINNQLRDDNPAAVGKTLARLMHEGFSRDESLRLIGHVVAAEIFGVLKEGRRYDEKRYIEMLNALPKLPWGEPAGQ